MINKNTQILLGVFAVLLIATLLIQRNREQNPPENGLPTPTPATMLFDFTFNEITGLRIEAATGEVVELQSVDGAWQLLNPLTLPDSTDQTAIITALSQIGIVRILNSLNNPPGLDAIGLATPAHTIEITLSSGKVHKLLVGNASPTGNGLYVSLDGASPILVDKYSLERLTAFIATPPVIPPPILDVDNFGLTDTLTSPPEGTSP